MIFFCPGWGKVFGVGCVDVRSYEGGYLTLLDGLHM